MSKYPCKECILISTCTHVCDKTLEQPVVKNGICGDCGSKIKHTCISCGEECHYCDNCNRIFDLEDKHTYTTYRMLIINLEDYCWNEKIIDSKYKIKKSYLGECHVKISM